MVGLTDVITRLDLFEVDRQRREEEAVIQGFEERRGLSARDAAGGGVRGDTDESLWEMDRK